jgi:hypothetical protein
MPDLDPTVDVDCVDDFKATMPSVRGREALAQRLARRLTTPRGRFLYWPEFGYDVRTALLSKKRPEQIAIDIESECLKDEQVAQARADVTVVERTATIRISVMDDAGPFEFTLTIDEARAQLSELLETA